MTFRYKSQQNPTLRNINLSIYPGQKILIAGASGSGKSTLAHCLNALIPCSMAGDMSGVLRVCGEKPQELGVFGMSKRVGTVLQDTDGQFIALTVGEDLAFALENENTPQEEMFEKVREVAEKLELTAFMDNAPGALSGGQKQRVSIGGVMTCDVKILLFDEPLANLDPATGKRTIVLIDELMKNENLTVVIIEHRLEDVLYRKVDRIVLVDEGQIIADKTPDKLLSGSFLTDHGIREPLYIAALKAAGAEIKPEDKPSDIGAMDLAAHKEKVRAWYHSKKRQRQGPERETLLSVSHLGYSYDETRKILKDVSFEIKKGEMVALVGKNGAGKSTLASLICGFLSPDEGEITWKGQNMAGLSIKERGEIIGYCMQSPNQMISKPMIYDEVALGLTARGVPEAEVKERVTEVLRICGLYPFRNWPVSALSFGQKKRVSIASILVMDPEMIILDEPTAGQDYRHYTEIMEFLKYLRKELGITILMITHDMHLMLEYTDRSLVLAEGELIMDGAPEEVLTNDEICDRAYLKRTSLYDLAVRCDIPDPGDFVATFIEEEREQREKKS